MLSVEQVSKIWNVSGRRVRALCASGAIAGAQKVGRSYLIPDDAKNPKEIKVKQKPSDVDKILIVTKDKDSFIAKAIAHNFLLDEKEVFCTTNLQPLSKLHRIKKVNSKTFCEYEFVLTVFVNCFDENFCSQEDEVVYVGKKNIKNDRILKIVGFDLLEENDLSYHGKMFYAEEGILKQISSILDMKLDGKLFFPVTLDMNDCGKAPQLIKRFSSVQKAYEFLREQYFAFDDTDEFTHIAVSNEVEFSDSNQELDYFKSVLLSLRKGVHANFIYLFTKQNLSKICNHFTTRMYAENLKGNSVIYFINYEDLKKKNPEIVSYIYQGVIYYANKSVYHDQISEYTLGFINASKDDIEKAQKVTDFLIENSEKVSNLKELEAFYELHK